MCKIHDEQTTDDLNKSEGENPQDTQNGESRQVTGNNELGKNKSNHNEGSVHAPHYFPVAADHNTPPAITTVQGERAIREDYSPERKRRFTGWAICFGLHYIVGTLHRLSVSSTLKLIYNMVDGLGNKTLRRLLGT